MGEGLGFLKKQIKNLLHESGVENPKVIVYWEGDAIVVKPRNEETKAMYEQISRSGRYCALVGQYVNNGHKKPKNTQNRETLFPSDLNI